MSEIDVTIVQQLNLNGNIFAFFLTEKFAAALRKGKVVFCVDKYIYPVAGVTVVYCGQWSKHH